VSYLHGSQVLIWQFFAHQRIAGRLGQHFFFPQQPASKNKVNKTNIIFFITPPKILLSYEFIGHWPRACFLSHFMQTLQVGQGLQSSCSHDGHCALHEWRFKTRLPLISHCPGQ
jgi:hypothetical protein